MQKYYFLLTETAHGSKLIVTRCYMMLYHKSRRSDNETKILLASHGPLANGMKKTAEFLMGQNENVETLCAYVDEQSKDLPAMVEKWMNERNPEDQWVVITDIFGGSINNEFMIRAQEGGYWLIAGMNLPLVLSLWYETENLTEKQLETNISEASEGIVLCNKLLSEDTVEEDDGF